MSKRTPAGMPMAERDDGMRALSSCDRRRTNQLADALWSAGEQLMAAQLRGAR